MRERRFNLVGATLFAGAIAVPALLWARRKQLVAQAAKALPKQAGAAGAKQVSTAADTVTGGATAATNAIPDQAATVTGALPEPEQPLTTAAALPDQLSTSIPEVPEQPPRANKHGL